MLSGGLFSSASVVGTGEKAMEEFSVIAGTRQYIESELLVWLYASLRVSHTERLGVSFLELGLWKSVGGRGGREACSLQLGGFNKRA